MVDHVQTLTVDWTGRPGGTGSVPLPGTGHALFVSGYSADLGTTARKSCLTLLRQVHGSLVLLDPAPGETGDALVVTDTGRCPAVRVADCLPVGAVTTEATGMAHAGWRGLASGVVERFLSALPGDILAVSLGPCICGSCYEVGEEVLVALGAGEPGSSRDGAHVDLKSVALDRLIESGVPAGLVWRLEDCTLHAEHPDGPVYHSYRRDGERSGRNLVWIDGV